LYDQKVLTATEFTTAQYTYTVAQASVMGVDAGNGC
jgi:hypothetical protein